METYLEVLEQGDDYITIRLSEEACQTIAQSLENDRKESVKNGDELYMGFVSEGRDNHVPDFIGYVVKGIDDVLEALYPLVGPDPSLPTDE